MRYSSGTAADRRRRRTPIFTRVSAPRRRPSQVAVVLVTVLSLVIALVLVLGLLD